MLCQTAEETAARLQRAGFALVSCWLEPKSVQPADPRSFVRTVCLVRHLDPLPEGLRGPFVQRVLARAGDPLMLEYVRLNMTAVREPDESSATMTKDSSRSSGSAP